MCLYALFNIIFSVQFVNGHYGNKYLRELAMTRKCAFDSGNYTDKRKLATEVVTMIQQLQPPGRFLTLNKLKPNKTNTEGGENVSSVAESHWEAVGIDKAIMKTCQVMRDIDRPDRKYRVDRKLARLNRLQALNLVVTTQSEDTVAASASKYSDQPNVVENCNEPNSRNDSVLDDDTLQTQQQQQQEKLEPQQQQQDNNRADNSNGIDAIIIDVVDDITAIPIEGERDHVG